MMQEHSFDVGSDDDDVDDDGGTSTSPESCHENPGFSKIKAHEASTARRNFMSSRTYMLEGSHIPDFVLGA